MMNSSNAENNSEVPSDNRKVRHQQGLVLVLIGLSGFIPALAVTVFSNEHRLAGAVAMFFFWLLIKVGKTIMRANALKQ